MKTLLIGASVTDYVAHCADLGQLDVPLAQVLPGNATHVVSVSTAFVFSQFGDNRHLRTAAEIAFRVRQEVANIRLWMRPPAVHFELASLHGLPLPDPRVVAASLTGSEFALQVVTSAAAIRAHRFPIFGGVVETGPEVRWRRDYRTGIETGLRYFRRIPYLDAQRAGDHKLIWELNRHQHLVTLAQAYLFTED